MAIPDFRDRDLDWCCHLEAVKICVIERQIAPGTEAQVNGVEYGGLAAVTGSNQAVDPLTRTPIERADSVEMVDFNLSDDSHYVLPAQDSMRSQWVSPAKP